MYRYSERSKNLPLLERSAPPYDSWWCWCIHTCIYRSSSIRGEQRPVKARGVEFEAPLSSFLFATTYLPLSTHGLPLYRSKYIARFYAVHTNANTNTRISLVVKFWTRTLTHHARASAPPLELAMGPRVHRWGWLISSPLVSSRNSRQFEPLNLKNHLKNSRRIFF